jgi:ElaB/YqjD/DUF883 family membrane-anchored ribosome-binding protein
MTMSRRTDTARTADTELAALRDKVEALMAERVTPAMSALADQAEDLANGAAATFRHETGRLGDAVRAQPFAALGVAAAVGFVLALLARR